VQLKLLQFPLDSPMLISQLLLAQEEVLHLVQEAVFSVVLVRQAVPVEQ
jgi:hypothetical protein